MRWFAGACLACLLLPVARAASLPADAIGAALGTPVTTQGEVVRASWPRDDVKVTVDRVPLPPSAGLTSWAAFTPSPQGALVMADTVVFQDEVDAAIDAAIEQGLRVTALHNHFSFDQPRALFLHLEGSGDPQALAANVRAVWNAIRVVRARHAIPIWGFGGSAPGDGSPDAKMISRILGLPATSAAGVVKVSVGRAAKADGVTVGDAMGVTTWAAFVGSRDRAAVDGDFVMLAGELQAVARALRQGGLHVVAIHNHMLDEEPRYYFLHYWGEGSADALAHAVRAALDAQRAGG